MHDSTLSTSSNKTFQIGRLPLLSKPNTHRPILCLTINPATPTPICMARILMANRSSLIGPNQTNHRFRIVKFDEVIISPFGFFSSRMRYNFSSMFRASAMTGRGGRSHCVTLGSSKPVRALKRGRRCLGHGIMWNSCGSEYNALKI